MTTAATAQLVKRLAREVGFDLAGITAARRPERGEYYREWLAAGYGGEMTYLARNVRFRLNPAELLPGARSVICVAVNYAREDAYIGPTQMHDPHICAGRTPLPLAASSGANASDDGNPPRGLVAQYARGRDYHFVLHRMLAALLKRLRAEIAVPFAARAFVDTGPLLERELAACAGLGWIGKNTCLLNGTIGSYLFLGELLTDLELAADGPVTDQCAQCQRCIDACPTGALIGPRQMDARRCISYLTVECRGAVPAEFHAAIGARVFGCDICQQVCPYNRRAPIVRQPELRADVMASSPELPALARLTSGGYRRLVRNSAGRRANRAMWRRNAAIALVSAKHLL